MFEPKYERQPGMIVDPKMTDRVGLTWAGVGAATGTGILLYFNNHLGAPHRDGVTEIQQLEASINNIGANDQHAQAAMIGGSAIALKQHNQNMKREAKITTQKAEMAKNLPTLPFGTGVYEGIGMAVIPVILAVAGTQKARLAIRGKQARKMQSQRRLRSAEV